jgi:hypothetical protein
MLASVNLVIGHSHDTALSLFFCAQIQLISLSGSLDEYKFNSHDLNDY